MASFNDRLNDNEYKLWLKTGLCLTHTKEGVGKFADDRSRKIHNFIKLEVEKHANLKTPEGAIKAMEEICGNAKPVKRGNIWSLGCCNDCEIYIKEIAKYQEPPFRIEQSNWRNSEVRLWPKEPWEIAKVFMNVGQSAVQKNSQETDLSGLLNFVGHCKVPLVDIQNTDNISKVRNARNATMHSASMKMSNAEFLKHTDAMIDLLKDPLFMDKIEEAQNAVKEIQKIVQIDFVITSFDEYTVLTEKTSSLQEQNDRLQEEVKELRIKHTELEKSDETTRSLVKTGTDKIGDVINTLKVEISEKEKQLKEHLDRIVETAQSSVATETGQRIAAINTLKAEIREREKQLKENLDEIDETARSLVKTETDERETAIDNLKVEISEKEKQLKEVHMSSDLFSTMQNLSRPAHSCKDKIVFQVIFHDFVLISSILSSERQRDRSDCANKQAGLQLGDHLLHNAYGD